MIITTKTIRALSLPALKYKEVVRNMEEFTGNIVRSRKKTFPDRNKNLNDFLLWLWVVVVELVFEVLEFSRNEDSRPRIWWIGLAALSHAPFHAAGDHSDPDSDKNTMCRAISTYIPTVRYLAYARDKPFDIVKDEAKLLFAVMPTTPGKKDLQGVTVTDEIGRIFTTVSESIKVNILNRPAGAQVLEDLQTCKIAHFACHGVTDTRSPSQSHLQFVMTG